MISLSIVVDAVLDSKFSCDDDNDDDEKEE